MGVFRLPGETKYVLMPFFRSSHTIKTDQSVLSCSSNRLSFIEPVAENAGEIFHFVAGFQPFHFRVRSGHDAGTP